jgi:cellulose 1,4-beta-cellobiosidase
MRLGLSRFSRRRIAMMAVGVVAVGGVAAVSTVPAFAAVSCNVRYDVQNSWNSGFQAQLIVTNTGDAWTSWTITFTLPSGTVTQGWNGRWTPSGSNVTVQSETWNGNVGTGAQVAPGFLATWTGTQPNMTTDTPAPSSFTINGVVCGGSTSSPPTSTTSPPPTTTSRPPTTTSRPPTTTSRPPTTTSRPPTTTSRPPTTTGGPTGPTCTPPNCNRVDNPYAGATVYNNPQWRANAVASGGSAIANQPTAVWMDRISAIAGNSSPTTGSMGLAQHLDAAVTQDSANGSAPLVFQLVIYNLPGRDCAALASNGELGPTEITRYQNDYINPIRDIIRRPAYANLRIVAIIEIDSLPNLVTNVGGRPTSTQQCDVMLQNGNYQRGVGYALAQLGSTPNVYTYIDAAHHGWIGWPDNFGATANMLMSAATFAGTGSTPDHVHGFIVNTANYSALTEQFVGPITEQLRQTTWIDFNSYNEELAFAQGFRNQLISAGFRNTIGMLIDTSRNGWGGPGRRTSQTPNTGDNNAFVNANRLDRRIHKGNWCNQSNAGLGERPRSAPASGIDAYVWVKPPGESDGSSTAIPNDEGKGFDRMCDPTYGGNARNGNSMTGALPNSPLSGHWFDAQFRQLMANAFPAL